MTQDYILPSFIATRGFNNMDITPWVLVNFKNKHVESHLVAMGFYEYHRNCTIDCLSRSTYTILDTNFAEILGISPELSTQTHWLYTRIATVLPSSQIQPTFEDSPSTFIHTKQATKVPAAKSRLWNATLIIHLCLMAEILVVS